MDISVVVLTRNEERNIQQCLDSLLRQDYSDGLWEILVVDGRSTDGTLPLVSRYVAESSRIRLAANLDEKIAPGRNVGLRESLYPYVAFTDADCVVQEDWLTRLSRGYRRLKLEDPRIVAVGGGNLPHDDKPRFMKALGIYLDSFLGCFNSVQGRNHAEVRRVESLACLNVLYEKASVEAVGGFDEELGNVGEDLDLNLRLGKRGFHLYYLPEAHVYHKLRPNLSRWLTNMGLYGRGRALVSYKHRQFGHPFFLMPAAFGLAMFSILGSWATPLLLLPALYFPMMALYCFGLALKSKRLDLLPDLWLLFVGSHLVYASNLLFQSAGLLVGRIPGSHNNH